MASMHILVAYSWVPATSVHTAHALDLVIAFGGNKSVYNATSVHQGEKKRAEFEFPNFKRILKNNVFSGTRKC